MGCECLRMTSDKQSDNVARMDDPARSELDELLAAQKALHEQLSALDRRIERFRARVESTAPVPIEKPRPRVEAEPSPVAKPPPLVAPSASVPRPRPFVPSPIEPPAAKAETTSPAKSFEFQLGTVWLVRIGIVMLITGLVFLGNYAYQNLIGKLGPFGKLTLLYIAGGALTGVGFRIERGRETLRNYARVLMAGGLAAIYYTTYAAHFVPQLRVIASPIVAGVLLLALAGGIVWIANRKQSETLAIFAVLLSYYTSTINPIASFTLFSNLLLTAAAVYFLVRNRWATITFASLFATYLSYGYWRYFHANTFVLQPPLTRSEFWTASLFLLGYWALFTAAAFLCRYEGFSAGKRTAFLSFNNAAFFGFVAPMLPQIYPGSFWIFALGFGSVLLGLAWLANRRERDDLFMDAAYLGQGLLLVTIGLVAKITGYQLALVLAAESAVLLTCCRARHGWLFQTAAGAVATAAFVLTCRQVQHDRSLTLLLCGSEALVFLYNARWFKRLTSTDTRFNWRSAYFAALSLALGLMIIVQETGVARRGPVLAIVAVLLTGLVILHGLPELAMLGQIYLLLAHVLWLSEAGRSSLPWWNPLIVLTATFALSHWWQGQKRIPATALLVPQAIYALAATALLYTWLEPKFSPDVWIVVPGCVALALLAYGIATRAWLIASFGQFFTLICVFQFFSRMLGGHPSWRLTLGAIAVLIASAIVTKRFVRAAPENQIAIFSLTLLYRAIALAMFVAWGFEYVPEHNRFWFFAFSGLALFTIGALTKDRERLILSAALTLTGLGTFWFGMSLSTGANFGNLVAILALLGSQQLGRRLMPASELFPRLAQNAVIIAGTATLWLHISRWVSIGERGFYMTVAWSVLAGCVFAAGILLRERPYRLLGLTILACAVGRIAIVDVWQLETLYRILSFIVLSIVLLSLGFVYNRFADKFRDWI